MIGEYILLALLLASAVFIVVAVLFQRSEKEGLSGTIVGGSETYYGKEKAVRTDKLLNKWTLIVGLVFALAVVAVYVIQPDYVNSENNLDYWKKLSEFSSIFSK
jgi:preprotein translocase subunit SecG